MPTQEEKRFGIEGEDGAQLLAQLLRDAVRSEGGNGETHRIAGRFGAAMLADTGAGTAEHSEDVVLIAAAIGEKLGIHGDEADDLLAAAQLHDIGKACVPRQVLEKPGPLDEAEWALIRRHTIVGEQILSAVPELDEVGRLVRHSHERWDGGGYPDQLAGVEIPLGSRIIFCADAFHAMRVDRPYRTGRSGREAVAEIRRCAGTQFDPQVTAALDQVVRERGRRSRGVGGSARLLALLMCLAVGGTGSAVARSGALGEAPSASAPTPPVSTAPPPGCGTAACPTVATPVGGLLAVGAPGEDPAPRVLFPGLPGQLNRAESARDPGASGNRGKSAAAKARRAEKAEKAEKAKGAGKGKGPGKASNGASNGAGSGAGSSAYVPSGSSGGSGGNASGGGSHAGGGGSHGSGSGSRRGGRGRGGGSGGGRASPQGSGNASGSNGHGR